MLRPWNTILKIEIKNKKAVFQQIADGITEEIKKGRLTPGTTLPGTRALAEDIGVNRKTVVLAYETLMAEGWLSTAYKKGTFVSEKLPEINSNLNKQKQNSQNSFKHNLFTNEKPQPVTPIKPTIVFDDGLPDLKLAPINELARAYRRVFQQKARWKMMGYGDEKGEERLRIALSEMLRLERGLSVDAANICVTRGSQMALYLVACTLIKPGDVVAVENPGYDPVWKAFIHAGASLQPVMVDEQGICATALEKLCKRKKLKAVYVTPHHQFPTTVNMKADRRIKLLELSCKYGFAIIEDDYDHDYHFCLRNVLPIASSDGASNVIYVSSLAKLIAPAVRIGYVAGPKNFIDSLAALRKIIDRQGDNVMELAVAELMEEGAIRKHARRAFFVYKERRDLMAAYLDMYLSKRASYEKPDGGLAYWVKFNKSINTTELAAKLLKKGIFIPTTERFSFDGKPLNALRLGYASLNENELENGIKILSGMI